MSSINIVKNSLIGDVLASKLLYFVNDDCKFNSSDDFRINNYNKLKKDKKRLVNEWLYRLNIRNVTLSNNSQNNINKLTIFNLIDSNIINCIYDLLYPIFNKTVPDDIILNSYSMPKSKRIFICERDFNINDSYIICNKKLYNNPTIKL
jgi:hypothetical protein